MKRTRIVTTLLLLLPPALHAQQPQGSAAPRVSAEPWFRGGTLMLHAELGGTAYTDFQRALARPAAGPGDMPDFRRRVSARTTATAGAAATWWLGDSWGIRAATSYSPTRFSVWNEEQAQQVLDDAGTAEPHDYARLTTWTATAAAVVRLPFSLGQFVPYALAGGGAVRYVLANAEEVPPEARARFEDGSWTGAAAVFGAGAAVPLQRGNLLLTFELTNHLSRTPLDDEGLGEAFEISGVALRLDADPDRGTDGIGLTSQLRLTVGLTLPLRR